MNASAAAAAVNVTVTEPVMECVVLSDSVAVAVAVSVITPSATPVRIAPFALAGSAAIVAMPISDDVNATADNTDDVGLPSASTADTVTPTR